MKAIDFYSGIGGWTLGFKMAGVEIVDSFEWWEEANKTHGLNFGKEIPNRDIRQLTAQQLPKPGSVDFVIGSPPCTQFSFANRGGSGDIQDGLKDIFQFLWAVEYLKPKYWAFENVPRVSQILAKELERSGSLHRFADLVTVNEVFDISDFGLPQKRTRAIIGNYPVSLLRSYMNVFPSLTLRDVVEGLDSEIVVDPIHGIQLSQQELTDHLKEEPLTIEEARLNWEQKSFHPVFNRMQYPDSLDRPSRTVTALCTRVSRESIVIEEMKGVRRLTIRERACLQGFPITYQFYGKSYEAKIKMIGNAIPPLMTYFIAQAMLETPVAKLLPPNRAKYIHSIPVAPPTHTPPIVKAAKYSDQRKFKSAIPGLRFGSGMRFEFENYFDEEQTFWRVNFFFGNSKDIRSIDLGSYAFEEAMELLSRKEKDEVMPILKRLANKLRKIGGEELQLAWVHRGNGAHPHNLCDEFGEIANDIINKVSSLGAAELREFIASLHESTESNPLPNEKKILVNAIRIFVGIVVGSWVNSVLETQLERVAT